MKRYQNPRKTLSFVFIASLLMIVTDFIFSPGITPPSSQGEATPEVRIYENSEIEDFQRGAGQETAPEESQPHIESLVLDIPQPDPLRNSQNPIAKLNGKPASLNIDKAIIKSPPPVYGKGLVVVIIDDMGMDRKRSYRAIDLPAPVTLAFLPYAPQLVQITTEAIKKGHELLIHVPMQPVDSSLDPGPLSLRTDMTQASFDLALEKIMNSFGGYVGINNHMGSKMTQDKKFMDRVMETLKKEDLIFIDSKTIGASVAAQSASEHGLRYAERDIFLDHENTKEFVMESLDKLEQIAKRRGYAIAIGHPKDATLEGLQEWLPTIKKKGLTLVPVSKIAHRRPLSPQGRGQGEGAMQQEQSSNFIPAASPSSGLLSKGEEGQAMYGPPAPQAPQP